jgi:hypothetical protein
MAGAVFRVRRRVLGLRLSAARDAFAVLGAVLDIIDEELERDAEFSYTRPINPDQTTTKIDEAHNLAYPECVKHGCKKHPFVL